MTAGNAKFRVFYDGECSVCSAWAGRFRKVFARRGIGMAPLQDEAVRAQLGLIPGASLTEMKVLTGDGRIFGGADGLLHIFRAVWWLVPLYVLGCIPPARQLFRRCYRWYAARRHCHGGQCQRPGAPPAQPGRPA